MQLRFRRWWCRLRVLGLLGLWNRQLNTLCLRVLSRSCRNNFRRHSIARSHAFIHHPLMSLTASKTFNQPPCSFREDA
ncbi:hypothetical protein BDV18DRAFT_128292 [Aspergillus unguis]